MKTTALTLPFILVILFSIVTGLLLVKVGKANPGVLYFKPQYCNVHILSPEVWIELNPDSFRVIFSADTNYEIDVDSCFYILDGQNKEAGVKIEDFQLMNERIISDEMMPDINTTYFPYKEYIFGGQIFLVNLSIGEHELSIGVQNSKEDTLAYETITFEIPEKPDLGEIESIRKTFVLASLVTAHVVLVGIGWLLYGINRKR